MNRLIQPALVLLLVIASKSFAQSPESLRSKILQIASDKNAVVGVSVVGNDEGDTVSLNGNSYFPMQSVFKYHIAVTVLSQIGQGRFPLDRNIELRGKDLLPGLWSPLREENPDGGNFPVSKLIEYAVSKSDNAGCDALLRLIGGPEAVEEYFISNGITDISVRLNEEQMQSDWDLMFQNRTTPKAASEALIKFYYNTGGLLSESSHDFIWKVMKETGTGANRLKGQLPEGTIVAHKTGSSGTNKDGLTAAVNDIGIVFLPDGKYFFISVFVTNSTESEETNERIIAEIAKAAWDYFIKKQ
ncbi:MAG: class A beta-lactamase, subclass A2 [Ignavibacteria bacterium]|nr:class A beta-lactamase, subclass A2 [Ignavibacteria bacterium]